VKETGHSCPFALSLSKGPCHLSVSKPWRLAQRLRQAQPERKRERHARVPFDKAQPCVYS
jgi:hypothetical protein